MKLSDVIKVIIKELRWVKFVIDEQSDEANCYYWSVVFDRVGQNPVSIDQLRKNCKSFNWKEVNYIYHK